MSALTLTAHARTETGKQNKIVRRKGELPAVLYGHGVAAQSLALSANEFSKVYRKAGESTLVDLAIDGGTPTKVIINDIQRHPLTNAVIHVDLHQVKMTEKLRAEIVLAFAGEPAAVKELGGVLVKNLDHVKVETLPADLVPEILVDVSSLKTFDDVIHVKDLVLPKGIEVLDKADEVVALVTPPRSEAELAELEKATVDEKTAVENIEGVKKEEKKDDESGESDAAAKDADSAKASDKK